MATNQAEITSAEVEEWFRDEMVSMLMGAVRSVASILEGAENDIRALEESGLEDTFIERSIRDMKAIAFDALQKSLLNAL